MDKSNWIFLVVDFGFLLILMWVVWRLRKNQIHFKDIENQLQLLFKRIDDFLKKHV